MGKKGIQKMDAKQSVIRPWWGTVFFIALGSAIFLTIQNIVDSAMNQNYALATDKLTAASAYLFVGGWFGVVVCLVLGKVMGSVSKLMKVSENIQPAPLVSQIRTQRFSSTQLAIIAGILGAFSTLIYLWGFQLNDLGVMVALANCAVIVIVFFEWLQGKVTLKSLLLPSLFIVVSVVLVAYTSAWRKDSNILIAQAPELLMVLVGLSVLNASGEIVSKSAVDNSTSINIQAIRFVALAVTGTILTLGWAILRGQWVELMAASLHILTTPPVYVLLVVLFAAVFLNQVFELQAKKQNSNVSEVVMVQSLNVGMGFLASLILNAIHNGFVGPVPTDPETVVVRAIGVAGLMLALVLLQSKKRSKPNR